MVYDHFYLLLFFFRNVHRKLYIQYNIILSSLSFTFETFAPRVTLIIYCKLQSYTAVRVFFFAFLFRIQYAIFYIILLSFLYTYHHGISIALHLTRSTTTMVDEGFNYSEYTHCHLLLTQAIVSYTDGE